MLPDIELNKYRNSIQEETEEIKDKSNGSQVFGVIGIGHCGSKIAQEFYHLGYRKCFVINTATMDLNPIEIPEKQKILMDIGQEGAAKDVKIGYSAVKKYEHNIYDSMNRFFGKVDRILVAFGGGGGTGTGGVLKLIDIAGSYLESIGVGKNKVSVLMTLPDEGELRSKKIRDNAYMGLRFVAEASQNSNIASAFVVDNGAIKKLYPGVPVKEYWKIVNSSIAGLFHAFNVLSAQSSPYFNFDPSDYSSVLDSGGFGIMGSAVVENYGSKEAMAEQMRDNVKKTLWASGFDLTTAKAAGVIAVIGTKLLESLSQDVLNYGMEAVARLTSGAVVYRGIYEDEHPKVRVYTIIGGLSAPELLGRLDKDKSSDVDPLYNEITKTAGDIK